LNQNKTKEAIADLKKVLEISENEVLLTEAQKVLKLIETDMRGEKR
jgi:hypothetical protein